MFRLVSGELFRKKFPGGPSTTGLITLSAVLFLVVSQGGFFGTKPPDSPAKTSSLKN
jgi:hypothetical protein